MPIALAFVVATLFSAFCLRAVTKWTGCGVPIVDLLIIAGLRSGLALLPAVCWVLATVIMSLLVTRATEADSWPSAVLMAVGSNEVWLFAKTLLLG
jgi:hypothetical protein